MLRKSWFVVNRWGVIVKRLSLSSCELSRQARDQRRGQRAFIRAVNAILLALSVTAHAVADDKTGLKDGLIFHAGFDGSMDAKLFPANGDGCVYTADSPAVQSVERGNKLPEVSMAKNAGRIGDALRFTAKTQKVLCFKAASNGFEPRDNWSGTVSLWLKLDPDKDLPEGYCDPLQITAKKWDDSAFFIDFDKTLPRDFRLGVFSDPGVWNPKNIPWDDFPVAERPMVVVQQPSFSHDAWTHVVFTFDNFNSLMGQPSSASLFVNGKLQGSINQPMRFDWPKSTETKEAMIMLGINYVGDMDELAIFRRALSADEIKRLYDNPGAIDEP